MGAWTDEVREAFERIPNGIASYPELYANIVTNTHRALSTSWQATVRREIEQHSSDSESFLGKEDLFYTVNGLGGGVWGLRSSIPFPIAASDVADPTIAQGQNSPVPRNNVTISRIVRDTKKSQELKLLYGNRCQICDTRIELFDRTYSEGHHLQPLGMDHNGPDKKENILVVCPNHHTELDYGAIAIDPSTLLVVHCDSQSPFNGQQLKINPLHPLSKRYLRYHWTDIYSKAINEGYSDLWLV